MAKFVVIRGERAAAAEIRLASSRLVHVARVLPL